MSGPNKEAMTEDEGPSADYFNHLNDDCLSQIFMYLSHIQKLEVATVCKRWRDAAPLAWKNVKTLNCNNTNRWMDDPTQRVTYKCIATILRKCGGSLHTLQLGQCCNFEILSLVKQHCCNLRKLEVDVYECDWDAKKLFSSVLRSLQLEYLKITASPRYFSVTLFKAMPSETLTEMHLRVYGLCPTIHPEIFQKFSKLTAITLVGFSADPDTLRAISQQNQLTHVYLPNLKGVLVKWMNGIRNVWTKPDISSLSQLTNLEYLKISSSMLVNDDLVIALSDNCKKLRSLDLEGSASLSDRGVQALAHLPHLEELDISSHHSVTDQHFGALCNLKKLNVKRCREVHDSGVIEIIQSAVNLQYLNLEETSVTENVLRAAADATSGRNTKLEVIVDHDRLKRRYY